jgi:hypothetical protein
MVSNTDILCWGKQEIAHNVQRVSPEYRMFAQSLTEGMGTEGYFKFTVPVCQLGIYGLSRYERLNDAPTSTHRNYPKPVLIAGFCECNHLTGQKRALRDN